MSSVSSSGGMSSGMLARRSPCSRNGPNLPTRTNTSSALLAGRRAAQREAADLAGVDLLDLVLHALLQAGRSLPKKNSRR